ncbi:hypothetical protein V8V91_21040 [Algoriphagus halophilus]|uniref:hypothetical protein n=1 Tax=Algoriphagus halophilus TaxID=226505 RepID=UPI003A70D8F7
MGIRVLEFVELVRGLPKMIRVDNGPGVYLRLLDHWCKEKNRAGLYPAGQADAKTAMWNAVTDRSEKTCLAPMYLILWMRSGKKRWNGWKIITGKGPMRHLDIGLPVDLLKELKMNISFAFQTVKHAQK